MDRTPPTQESRFANVVRTRSEDGLGAALDAAQAAAAGHETSGAGDHEHPFVIEHREALVYMLGLASELEHSICCQYLFAAFTMKTSTDEGLTDEQADAVKRWRRTIIQVSEQEMLHLALVQNLLVALGASPHLTRPNFPHPARHFPDAVQLTLVPFGEQALQHFVYLERPEGMEVEDAEGFEAALKEAEPALVDPDIVPQVQDFATVGHLYRSVEDGIAHLAEKLGEERLFIGPLDGQADADHFRWPDLTPVTDLASARVAIDTIVEQGEGARGDWRTSHFGRFVEILEEYRAMKAADPGFDPARPVMPACIRPVEGGFVMPMITDPFTIQVADLMNVGYEILLQVLYRYFAHTDETPEHLSTLADVAVGLMYMVVRPLGGIITTLPVGPDHLGWTAGPNFELFYATDYLLPHRGAAWKIMEERLREAAAFGARVQENADPALAPKIAKVGSDMAKLADRLAEAARA
jgi:Ferritin-like